MKFTAAPIEGVVGNRTLLLGDGVHPTPAGHALIAEHWRKATNI